ncbi:DNA fragmentation factor subunit alpha isoform X2 [Gopherus flavomarginatus]|uniref:DNA fragmentation factor subunit alpha isoform X2 n=1 Tax=Gopherus flavomarginatus TaxID=286002 RepID=UPI0021CBDEF6|nr:DNA fragmentation factor subunit alpha isoform X2 [Gopherus flavomarginatus]
MAGEGPGSGEGVSPLKQCLIRRKSQQEHHGVAASCLRELRSKACDILAIDKAWEPITLVLAEDGTIVDDEDYFLCLPPNTKFVALARNEKWTSSYTDGGTAWLSRESIDEVDCGEEKWKHLARQLKDDLSSIILMSEEDLQVLIDVPCSDLAQELSQNQPKTQMLQDTLQQALDRREEERQSKQLLELYMKALKNEGSILTKASEPDAAPREEMNLVDTDSSSAGASTKRPLSSEILVALKEKPAPELSLDSQDLELVFKEDTEALALALSWDKEKTEALQQACDQELSRRLQQVQALHSLRSISKGKKKLPWGDWLSSKRKNLPCCLSICVFPVLDVQQPPSSRRQKSAGEENRRSGGYMWNTA